MTATRSMPRALRLALALAAITALAACGTATGTPPPTQPGASTGPAAATPAPSPTAEPAPQQELVLGCLSVEAGECQFLAQAVLASLPPDRGAPFAIEIRLFGCENPNAPCPPSLSARPGKAVVEFLDQGEPLELSLQGPPLAPTIAPQDAFYLDLTQPSSERVAGAGPFPYEMGHCGVMHHIDFDGSFWLPVGQVDGDHPTINNAEAGAMRFLAPNRVEFRGDSGFTVQLARFPGPKHFWGCD